MPSAQDLFNQLADLGAKLDALNATSRAILAHDDQLVKLIAAMEGHLRAECEHHRTDREK